ncbi:UNVERIFIED_CONTAM: hypothetical protein GTU68_039029 [Idotea baltica]|nr:hypothetical protein [Idotea baltica]
MPAEWERHKQTWMIWPERTDNWRMNAAPAQKAFASVAKAIAQFEPVTIGASEQTYISACSQFNDPNIRVIELSNDDAWARDTGPTFVINKKGELRGVDWEFNAWGGLNGGLYSPWDKDSLVASKILQQEHCHRYYTENFVLEGGAIHVDGEGTLITTEECLLNSNRNPHLSRNQIEQYLKNYLNINTIIWLSEGLFNDETDGHIDNFCCYIRPAEVLLAWTNDPLDPNYSRCHRALTQLQNSTDARGRKLTIHKIPIPEPLYATQERLAGSYVNFLIVNNGIIAPSFDKPSDIIAKQLLGKLFPDRRVVMIPSREILLGGGNIHCITQQQPQIL